MLIWGRGGTSTRALERSLNLVREGRVSWSVFHGSMRSYWQ